MPFVPPVPITHSSHSTPVSGGLTGNVRPTMNYNNASATVPSLSRTKAAAVEDNKGSSMTERLASNLRHLGKKSQPRSRLPTSKATSGEPGLNAKCKGQWLSSSSKRLSGTLPASCTGGGSVSKTPQCGRGSLDSGLAKGEPQVRVTTTRYLEEDEARFTLTLTPEAVRLLQRRSNERQQRLAAWNAEVTSSTTDGRRRRHQPASRHGTLSSRASAVKNSHHNNSDILAPGDVSSLVKISLLNEWHKYDDVEYEEEEEDCVVDERVVLKCTEWLRGLENAPVTVGTAGLQYGGTHLKSF